MPNLTVSAEIDASPEAVFAAASDLERFASYVRDVDAFRILTAGATGCGTRFLHDRRIGFVKVSREVTITDWRPPMRFVASFLVLGRTLHTVHEIEGCGRTARLHISMRFTGNGWRDLTAWLVWLFALPYTRWQLRREIVDVKRKAEAVARISAPA